MGKQSITPQKTELNQCGCDVPVKDSSSKRELIMGLFKRSKSMASLKPTKTKTTWQHTIPVPPRQPRVQSFTPSPTVTPKMSPAPTFAQPRRTSVIEPRRTVAIEPQRKDWYPHSDRILPSSASAVLPARSRSTYTPKTTHRHSAVVPDTRHSLGFSIVQNQQTAPTLEYQSARQKRWSVMSAPGGVFDSVPEDEPDEEEQLIDLTTALQIPESEETQRGSSIPYANTPSRHSNGDQVVSRASGSDYIRSSNGFVHQSTAVADLSSLLTPSRAFHVSKTRFGLIGKDNEMPQWNEYVQQIQNGDMHPLIAMSEAEHPTILPAALRPSSQTNPGIQPAAPPKDTRRVRFSEQPFNIHILNPKKYELTSAEQLTDLRLAIQHFLKNVRQGDIAQDQLNNFMWDMGYDMMPAVASHAQWKTLKEDLTRLDAMLEMCERTNLPVEEAFASMRKRASVAAPLDKREMSDDALQALERNRGEAIEMLTDVVEYLADVPRMTKGRFTP
ncbi:hypothetical protein BT63DRAFT_481403 [Microthyrium microscopicum]|uniref:Uncharacterized protein n=1 Tax=Microthyrium microscopicum TaxID=703497 RepID=A0A6A6U7K9_9PEZI|nr:hypothetical protein BT63DRAFT_481403 [Microthyrium microscopicum]